MLFNFCVIDKRCVTNCQIMLTINSMTEPTDTEIQHAHPYSHLRPIIRPISLLAFAWSETISNTSIPCPTCPWVVLSLGNGSDSSSSSIRRVNEPRRTCLCRLSVQDRLTTSCCNMSGSFNLDGRPTTHNRRRIRRGKNRVMKRRNRLNSTLITVSTTIEISCMFTIQARVFKTSPFVAVLQAVHMIVVGIFRVVGDWRYKLNRVEIVTLI